MSTSTRWGPSRATSSRRRPSRSIRRSTAAIVSWLDTFGRANAAAFDRQGWVYFKEENYDLFYPGYGDSYPSLRGAVGMTYEMAGGGRAGVALALAGRHGAHPRRPRRPPSDDLARHRAHGGRATAASCSRTSRPNRARPAAEPARTYLWPADQPEARSLADLLALHGVRVRPARARLRDPRPPARQGGGGRGAAAPLRRRHLRGLDRPAARQPGPGAAGDRLADEPEPSSTASASAWSRTSTPSSTTSPPGRCRSPTTCETWVAPGDVAGGRPPARRKRPAASRGTGTSAGSCRRRGSPPTGWRRRCRSRKVHFRVALAPFSGGGAELSGRHPVRPQPGQRRRGPRDASVAAPGDRSQGAGALLLLRAQGALPGLERHAGRAPGAGGPAERRGGGRHLLRLSLVSARPADRGEPRPARSRPAPADPPP